jgi:hypothetical protein
MRTSGEGGTTPHAPYDASAYSTGRPMPAAVAPSALACVRPASTGKTSASVTSHTQAVPKNERVAQVHDCTSIPASRRSSAVAASEQPRQLALKTSVPRRTPPSTKTLNFCYSIEGRPGLTGRPLAQAHVWLANTTTCCRNWPPTRTTVRLTHLRTSRDTPAASSAGMISARTSMPDRAVSSCRPPWFDATQPAQPAWALQAVE